MPIKKEYLSVLPLSAVVPGGTDIRRNNCNVKSIAPRRTVINNLILTTMTHISQFAVKDFDANENSNELKEYQVEVITFDGESETVYVEAYNEAEASNKAAAQVGNADYTMVYSYN